MRVTNGLSDPELAQILVSQAFPTMKWLREHGVRFVLSFGRQAFKDGDKYRFWGGPLVEAVGVGKGLSDQQFEVAQKMGINVRYSTQGMKLLQDDRGRVSRPPGPGAGGLRGYSRSVGGSGCRRLRSQRRDALSLLGSGLGNGEGSRNPLQHRGCHQDGTGCGSPVPRPLEQLPRRGLGHERPGLRRPHHNGVVPEALLSLWPHRQPRRGAVPG